LNLILDWLSIIEVLFRFKYFAKNFYKGLKTMGNSEEIIEEIKKYIR